MLAEVNYLCIVDSMNESDLLARQNLFGYCTEYLKELFEKEEYS